ncbi:MAG: cation:proton antiporter [bacterium]|nr:cation:proton antiporter [bacterium]
MRKLTGFIGLLLLAWAVRSDLLNLNGGGIGCVSISLGFLLLAAYVLGDLLTHIRLPRITGYLLAGLLFGPQLLGFVDAQSLSSLKVIDSLALTFIALSAGGELQISELRKNRRVILFSLTSLILVVLIGSTLLILAFSPLFSFTSGLQGLNLLVLAATLGAIATARSPASAIAIIKETRAHGPFTDVTLGLTVTMDILAIVIFAVVISVGEALLSAGGMDASYIGGLSLEIAASLTLGAGLGFALAAWLRNVESHHLITLFVLAIVVSEASHFLSQWLDAHYGVSFHLEPMLICIATGFVVRNFSAQGNRFLHVIEKGGLMVYTLFFALAGAALDLDILRHTWRLALLLVAIRFVTIQCGAWLGARLSGAQPVFRRYLGISFVTQAGVSLGLAKAVEARFPEWGPAVATLAIASITINQMIGPILFKQALSLAGEIGKGDE